MKRPARFILLIALLIQAAPARAYDFTDETARFSVQLPDDWVPLAVPDSKDLISLLSPTPGYRLIAGFTAPKAPENLPALIIQESGYAGGKSYERFTRADIQRFAAEMSGLKPSQLYSAETPAVPALVRSMSISATCFSNPPGFVVDGRSKDKFRAHTVVFLGTERMVVLNFISDDTTYNDFKPAFDKIATSFSYHYFHRPGLEGKGGSMGSAEALRLVGVIALFLAAAGGIFYAIYHRRRWDKV
jgi:hypothetical protein